MTYLVPDNATQAPFLAGTQEGCPDARSVSDDDVCAWCAELKYCPGEMSLCRIGWPGQTDADGYMQNCPELHLILL